MSSFSSAPPPPPPPRGIDNWATRAVRKQGKKKYRFNAYDDDDTELNNLPSFDGYEETTNSGPGTPQEVAACTFSSMRPSKKDIKASVLLDYHYTVSIDGVESSGEQASATESVDEREKMLQNSLQHLDAAQIRALVVHLSKTDKKIWEQAKYFAEKARELNEKFDKKGIPKFSIAV